MRDAQVVLPGTEKWRETQWRRVELSLRRDGVSDMRHLTDSQRGKPDASRVLSG